MATRDIIVVAASAGGVESAGGLAVVQDPEDALFSSMPRSAIAHVDVDCVMPASKVAGVIEELIRNSARQ